MYADGSCYEGTDIDFAATGGSCVQIDEVTKKIVKSARATLPEWMEQSAASGEHYGCHLGVLFTPRSPTIHADCASVVRSATSREYAVDWRRPFAGLWKKVKAHVWPDVVKTKAHRTLEEAKRSDDARHWHGNYEADLYAKMAAEAGRAPQHLRNEQDIVQRYWPRLILAVSALLSIWPFPKETYSAGKWIKGGKK